MGTFDIINKHFYNEKHKIEFLNAYPPGTALNYSRIFSYSKDIERRLGKDLYDFTFEEVEDLMYSLNPTSIVSAITNLSIIIVYIDWAIDYRYRKSNINVFKNMGNEWLKKFIESPDFVFFTEDKLHYYLSQLVNFQDRVIPALIFNGVEGKFLSEIVNLTVNDVDFENNTLTLTNHNKNKRKLVVPQYVMNLIGGAINEKIYLKNNGDISHLSKAPKEFELNVNNYVLRSRNTKKSSNSSMGISTIRARINLIQEHVDHIAFTATNIRRSGQLYMAWKLFKRDGKLDREQYDEIATRFNSEYLNLSDAEKSSYITTLKYIVNLENIKMLYGDLQ